MPTTLGPSVQDPLTSRPTTYDSRASKNMVVLLSSIVLNTVLYLQSLRAYTKGKSSISTFIFFIHYHLFNSLHVGLPVLHRCARRRFVYTLVITIMGPLITRARRDRLHVVGRGSNERATSSNRLRNVISQLLRRSHEWLCSAEHGDHLRLVNPTAKATRIE